MEKLPRLGVVSALLLAFHSAGHHAFQHLSLLSWRPSGLAPAAAATEGPSTSVPAPTARGLRMSCAAGQIRTRGRSWSSRSREQGSSVSLSKLAAVNFNKDSFTWGGTAGFREDGTLTFDGDGEEWVEPPFISEERRNRPPPKRKPIFTYSQAQRWARNSGIRTEAEWSEYHLRGEYKCAAPYRPEKRPQEAYEAEWTSWDDFLGVPYSFQEARERSRALKLKGEAEWSKLGLARRVQRDQWFDFRVPVYPDKMYKEEWKGWDDWLGCGEEKTGNTADCKRRQIKGSVEEEKDQEDDSDEAGEDGAAGPVATQ